MVCQFFPEVKYEHQKVSNIDIIQVITLKFEIPVL